MKQPELIIVRDHAGIIALKAYLEDKEFVALDTETTGLDASDEVIGFSVCACEEKAFYVIRHEYVRGNLIPCLGVGWSEMILDILKTKQLIGHNFNFDAMMIESNFKISLINQLHTDTMHLAHLLNENRRVGLKELCLEMYGDSATEEQTLMKASVLANGGLITKDKYEMYKADSALIAKYGAKDAWLTYKLFLDLVPQLYEQGLEDFYYQDETMPLLKGPTYDLNTTGLKVDLTALATLKQTLEAESIEALAFITSETSAKTSAKYPGTTKKNVFNIGSNQQLAWLLFGEMRLEFNTLTDTGKEVCQSLGLKLPYTYSAKLEFIYAIQASVGQMYHPESGKAKKIREPWAYIAVDKEALQKHSVKYKWIAELLGYQKKQKILNTYVIGIEERVKYGIIRPQFLQHGTTSGRFSSRNPNLQNLPREDQRVKNCLIARPGNVFVGADYSQLEPRVFAYMSGDTRLKEAFNSDQDFYSTVGMEVFNIKDAIPIKEGHPDAFGVKYKQLRNLSKVIALASVYGASASRLMKETGKSKDETQMDIDNYFEAFPDVAKMMTDRHADAKKNGQVTNLFGRPRRMPEAKLIEKRYGKNNDNLPYDARNLLNLAVNHSIQSTGASIVNRAMIQFYKNCQLAAVEAKIVSQIHDEIIVECGESDAESVTLLLQDAMENTVILQGVPLEAIPRTTKTLAK